MSEWKTRLSPEIIKHYTDNGYWEKEKTLYDYFKEAVSHYPDNEAVVHRDRRFTYRQMDGLVTRLAAGFRKSGVVKGDVVSFQLPNWMEAFAIYLACKCIGVVCNPIIPIYRDEEVGFILKQARAKIICIPGQLPKFDFPAMLKRLKPSLPDLEKVVVVAPEAPEGMIALGEIVRLGEQSLADFTPEKVDPNDVSLLMYTSGTTAEPKGVLHTYNTILWEAKSVRELMGLEEDYAVLMATPITHIGGLWAGFEYTALVGGKVVFQDVWNPEEAMKLIEKERCTFMTGPTPFLHGIVSHPKAKEYDLSSLKSFGCGGAPAPPQLIFGANNDLGVKTGRGYGLTEFSTITLYTLEDPLEKLATTDGSPAPGVEVRMADMITGEEVGRGQVGEILARGPECFVGYTDTSLNEQAFDGDWLRTGDLAVMDEAGYITITGRKKDIIIRSGENLSVREMEDAVVSHPKVSETAIVGMPDPVTGEKACAYVTLTEGAESLTLEEMKDFLVEKKLAVQKIPERIEVMTALPKTPTGKVRKNILKEDIARKLA